MKVAEFIEYLKTLDQDKEIYYSNDYWMSAYPLLSFEEGIVPYSGDLSGDNTYVHGYYINV